MFAIRRIFISMHVTTNLFQITSKQDEQFRLFLTLLQILTRVNSYEIHNFSYMTMQ